MILIDDVYQKVLALLNKEQRGYLTPQEFNLLANKAQYDIFDQYFYDIRTAYHKLKNNDVAFDEVEDIKSKLHFFLKDEAITLNTDNPQVNSHDLPADLYKIDVLTYKYPATISAGEANEIADFDYNTVVMEELDQKMAARTQLHPLTKASDFRPTFTRIQTPSFDERKIALYPDPTLENAAYQALFTYTLSYWRRPTEAKWGYVVVNGKALYNSTFGITTNFELDKSEEEKLVNKILQYAGVIIESPEVVQTTMVDQANIKQNQND